MIESALAFAPPPQAREDGAKVGYGHWRQSMAAVDARQAAMRYDMNARTAGPLPSFGSFLEKNAALTAQAYAPQNTAQGLAAEKPALAYGPNHDAVKGSGGAYTFDDVVDVINPLHHVPVVGMLYRSVTGDAISPISQILGGALFGGPIGAVAGTINAVLRGTTGKDAGENVLAFGGMETKQTRTASENLSSRMSEDDELFAKANESYGQAASLSLEKTRHNFASSPSSPSSSASSGFAPNRWNA